MLEKERMKTIRKLLTTFLFAAAFTAAFNLSVARADDDGERGGEIEGTESLDVDLAMTPTASAPAGSSIKLSLEAEDEYGATKAKLELETHGLPAGTYSVNVTLKSDGSTVSLGTFTVGNEAEGEVKFGDEEGTPFPANFNPFDIATVSVLNSSNVVIFTADLSNVSTGTSMTLNATVAATAGPAAPNATGTATLTAFAAHGSVKGSLQISGHGLPANMQLMIAINSTNAKKVNSDRSGNFNVKLGPKGKAGTIVPGVTLFQVTSVTVTDKFGNILLTINF